MITVFEDLQLAVLASEPLMPSRALTLDGSLNGMILIGVYRLQCLLPIFAIFGSRSAGHAHTGPSGRDLPICVPLQSMVPIFRS